MVETPPAIASGVHGVRLIVAALAEAAALEPRLTTEERARAAALAHPAVRARHIVSRVLRRQLLAGCVERPPGDLRFHEDAAGKPRLAGARGWDFNTSHAGDFVVVAAAPFSVGVDIEEVRQVPEMDRIVRRYFHPDEAAAWAVRPSGSQQVDFFILWCAREAAMKCAGVGLAAAMDITRVDPALMDAQEATARVGGFHLKLHKLEAPPGYVMVLGACL